MATLSPMVSMAPIRVTKTKAGSRDQNAAPKWRSNPGQAPAGSPIQAAATTLGVSYRPNAPATAQPAAMPMTGAQRRHTPAARSVTQTVTSRVASVLRGAAAGGDPSGTSVSRPNMIGIRVTGISMITVPHTVGVRIRRSSASRVASANWNSAETATSVASSPGPPFSIAVTQTAMKAADVPISST